MTDNRTTELLPCPFCGGEARHYAPGPIEHHVECTNPKCYAVTHGWSTKAEAIAAWNTRAELGSGTCEMHKDIGATQTLLTCSECGYTSRDYSPIFCGGCGARIRKVVDEC